jgi:hypothetical protein
MSTISVGTTNVNSFIVSTDTTGNLVLQTAGTTTALTLDSSQNATFVNDITSRNGLVPGELFYRLNVAYTGTATTSAQPLFGVGVTVSGSTVYQFESLITVSKSATASSHNLQLGFGGTATLNNISYGWYGPQSSITSYNDLTNGTTYSGFIQTATATTVASPGATAAIYKIFLLKGTVSINAGGTFIPQYTTSVSVGPYTTAIGSYFKLSRIGASGANTSIGTWA